MHAMMHIAFGVSWTWVEIYFGVFTNFVSNNFVYNMGDFILGSWHLLILLLAILLVTFEPVKWRDLFIFLDLLLLSNAWCLCMLNSIFLLIFLNGIDFLCFLLVLLCLFFFLGSLFGNYGNIFSNFWVFFLKLHQKCKICNFFLVAIT